MAHLRHLTTLTPAFLLLAMSQVNCGGGRQSPQVAAGSSPSSSTARHSHGGHAGADAPGAYSAESSGRAQGHTGSDVYRPDPTPDRPGLGTEFGEQRHSRVEHTRFVRSSSSPTAMLALHYNNASGVQAAFDHHRAELSTARSYAGGGDVAVTITDENGRALAGGAAGGRVYVVGQDGGRYNIEIRNDTRFRLEVVASVDGLDVIDGQSASPNKRGYVIQPFATITIDGFRTSDATVAAFRFGAVKDSYAARTSGDRNVGVIGVAIFSERGSEWTLEEIRRRDTADPFPGYAKPPANLAR